MSTFMYGLISISLILNYLSLLAITKYLRSQDQSMDALTKLVLAMADKHIYNHRSEKYGTGFPSMAENTEMAE